MHQIEGVVRDRGSRYAVSGATARDHDEVGTVLARLKRRKKYAKATHNTWAVIFKDGRQFKDDDGERGAGAIMLQILEQQGLCDHLVVVTRWYGGVHLGADRFRHVRTCVKQYLADVRGHK